MRAYGSLGKYYEAMRTPSSVICLVALCLAVAGCPENNNGTVAVPDVVGQPQATATQAIIAAGLTVGTITEDYSATVTAGSVISQNPAAGTNVSPSSVVSLTVSRGPQQATVPNLAGMARPAAEAAISGAGLAVGTVTEAYSETVAVGLVVSQNPVAGQQVVPGSAVDFVLSLGPLPPMEGTIVINDDATATNNPEVTLNLTWSGGGGRGVVRMRFSDDGQTWTEWEAPRAEVAHTLPQGDGYKTVRVQFMDELQNRSEVFKDFIRLDTVPPTGSIRINDGAATTTNREVTLNLQWDDGDGAGVTRMRFSDDGHTWTAWESLKANRTHTLPAGLGNHTVRVQYLDAAQNSSDVYNDYIKLVGP